MQAPFPLSYIALYLISFFEELYFSHPFPTFVSVAFCDMAFRSNMPLRQGLQSILKKRPDDVVFTTMLRTPIARMKKGYKDAYPEELLAHVLQRTRERLEARGVDKSVIEDVCTGTVLMELGGAKSGRMAALHAGMPITSAYRTVNRQCASSLQSITDIANSIRTGEIGCGIAAGAESMTRNYGSRAIPVDLSPMLKDSPSSDSRDCIMPMGETSEKVAEQWKIPRERQDEFAAASHAKAHAAQKDGRLGSEIEPITVRWIEPETGNETTREVSLDEGIRPDSTAEKLSKLKPVFRADGASTAGNSSQVSDGAVALTLARRDVAEKNGMEILGRWIGTATMGVKPNVMGKFSHATPRPFGPCSAYRSRHIYAEAIHSTNSVIDMCPIFLSSGIGPAYAVPKLLERYGISKDEIDLWELNEGEQEILLEQSLRRCPRTSECSSCTERTRCGSTIHTR